MVTVKAPDLPEVRCNRINAGLDRDLGSLDASNGRIKQIKKYELSKIARSVINIASVAET